MNDRFNWRNQVPLLAFLLVAITLAFLVFRYFILTFALAASVALMLAPAQRSLTRRLRGFNSLAAAVLVLVCTAVILVPVFTYGVLISRQVLGFLEWLRPYLEPDAWERLWRETIPARSPQVAHWLRNLGWEAPALSQWMSEAASRANHYVQVVLAGTAAVLLDLLIFLMMVFFLLRDGDDLREALRGISPFTRGQESELVEHLGSTVRAVLLAMIAVPLVQGVVAYAGFRLFGVPSALLWAVMVVFAALIPIVGSPLAWIPACVFLLATGTPGRAIGLALYGTLVISMVDNILKPMILRGTAQIHMMLGFLSILGGLFAFGPKGVVVGPVVLSLVLSAYRIYRYDILRWREEERVRPSPAAGGEPAVAGEAARLPGSTAL
jgi:predicted PurR-regulated permease PerM